MGGLGSGGHNRRGWGTVEAARCLDVFVLKRAGALKDGCRSVTTWTDGNGDAPSIELKFCPSGD